MTSYDTVMLVLSALTHLINRSPVKTDNKNSAECAPALCLHIKNSIHQYDTCFGKLHWVVHEIVSVSYISNGRDSRFGWSVCEKIVTASCEDSCDTIFQWFLRMFFFTFSLFLATAAHGHLGLPSHIHLKPPHLQIILTEYD